MCYDISDTNECSSYPCLNAATCTDKLNGYECHCRTGYSGETCAIGKTNVHIKQYLTLATFQLLIAQLSCLCSGNNDSIILSREQKVVIGVCILHCKRDVHNLLASKFK